MELKKYEENKIFVTGLQGSGKTTFAKKYSTELGRSYFPFDINWNYSDNNEVQFENLVKKYPTEFITDAIPYTELNGRLKFLDYYNDNIGDIKIICLCCTDKNELEKRSENKKFDSKVSAYSDFYHFYYKIVKGLYKNLNIEYFDSFTNEYITKEELFRRIEWIDANNVQVLIKNNFKPYLDGLKYDKNYGDIESINFIGYSKSFKTWDNIKNLVDWKGKKVADLGCFHCYFAFKIAKLGAIVTGFDRSSDVLTTSRHLNNAEGNIINLQQWSGGEEISSDFDISLCLNVIHHFADVKKSLQNIKSKTVIFETNQELVNLISEEFNIIKRVASHRPDARGIQRIILLCERK